MTALFINGSPNPDGATAHLARALFGNVSYETLQLTEYRINVYGQTLPGDQFDEVIDAIKAAEIIVIGSPLYWHNICGSVRNLLDRFYGSVEAGSMKGRILYFLHQGAAPKIWMLEAGEYTMKRFAGLYGFEWGGMATTEKQVKGLRK
jgi:multimeric flavodoxin WrbA